MHAPLIDLDRAVAQLKITRTELLKLAIARELRLCIPCTKDGAYICQVHRGRLPEEVKRKIGYKAPIYRPIEIPENEPDDEVKYLILNEENCQDLYVTGKLEAWMFEKGFAIKELNLLEVPAVIFEKKVLNDLFYDDEDSVSETDDIEYEDVEVETYVFGFCEKVHHRSLGVHEYVPKSVEIKFDDVLVLSSDVAKYLESQCAAADASNQVNTDQAKYTLCLQKMIIAHNLFWVQDGPNEETKQKKQKVLEALFNPNLERMSQIIREPLEEYETEIVSWFEMHLDKNQKRVFDSKDFSRKATQMIRPNKLISPQVMTKIRDDREHLKDENRAIFLDILKTMSKEIELQGTFDRQTCIKFLTEKYFSENQAKTAAKILRPENTRYGRPPKKKFEKRSN